MPGENKEIRLGLGVDEPAFRRVKTLLAEVTSEVGRLNQAMGKTGQNAIVGGGMGQRPVMGGGAPAPGASAVNRAAGQGMTGPMVKSIQDQQQALRVIASGSKDAMKAMADATKAALGDQRRELESFNRSIDALGKRYNELIKQAEDFRSKGMIDQAGVSDKMARGAMDAMGINARASAAGAANEKVLSDIQTTLEKAIHGPGGGGRRPPGSGGGGSDDPDKPKRQMSSWDMAMLGATIAKTVGHTIQQGGQVVQSAKGISDINAGGVLQTQTRVLHELARGDVRGLVELQRERAANGGAGSTWDQYGGRGAGTAMALGGIAGSVASVAANGVMMLAPGGALAKGATMVTAGDRLNSAGGVAGGIASAWGGIQNYRYGGVEAGEVGSFEQGVRNRRALNPLEQLTYDNLQGMAGARVAGAHALQGRHWQAAGLGMGYGLDFGQSVAIGEQMTRGYGIDSAFGAKGRSVNRLQVTPGHMRKFVQSGNDVLPQYSIMTPGNSAIMPNGDLRHQTGANSYVDFDKPSSMDVVKKTVGGSRGLTSMAMQLKRMGLADGGSIVGEMSQGVAGDRQKAPAEAWKQLEDVFARGFTKGVKDPVFAESMAKAVAQSTFGIGGAAGGAGNMAGMLASGLNGNSSMHDVQSAIRGFQGLDQTMAGNPYFNMVKTSAAIDSLGQNASGLGVRAIQQSSLRELLGGSEYLDDLGVTGQQRKGTLKTTFRDIFGSYASDANTPELAAAMRGNGDISKALNAGGPAAMKQAAALLTANLPDQFDYSSAKQAVSQIAGMDGLSDDRKNWTKGQKAEFDKFMKGHGDSAESVVATQMKVMFETLKKEMTPAFQQAITDAYKAVPQELAKLAEAKQDPMNPDFEAGKAYIINVSSVKKWPPDGRGPTSGGGVGPR